MPKYLGDVRCWVNSGNHMLSLSFSGFDPLQTWRALHLGQFIAGEAGATAGPSHQRTPPALPGLIDRILSAETWRTDMRRRDFILTVAGAALWSRTAKGQQASPVVGVLEVGTSGIKSKDFFAPAQARLAEMGFVEGRNLTIEFRGADFQQERLAGLASDLVQRRVAAIVTMGGPPAVAAKAVTQSIPIIFRTGFDPVGSGYVDSLNRPGGNVTGVFILNPHLISNLL